MPQTPPDLESSLLPTPNPSGQKPKSSSNATTYKSLSELRNRDILHRPFKSDLITDKIDMEPEKLGSIASSSPVKYPVRHDMVQDLQPGFSSTPSSPIKPTHTLQSSPPLRHIPDSQLISVTTSSPDLVSGGAFLAESSTSPSTPPTRNTGFESAVSDASPTPVKSAFKETVATIEDTAALTVSEFNVPKVLLDLTADDIENESDDICKSQLIDATELLRHATNTIQKFKGLISQIKLQNQLLTIETHEAAQRFEVENNIVKREVDRLRYEQIDHQNSVAAAETRSDSGTYRRRLQNAKLKLRDAGKEIEERDREIARIKKQLREGRLHREALEEALIKGQGLPQIETNEEKQRSNLESTPPPMGSFFGSSSSNIPSTPPSGKSKANFLGQQNGESGLDALGFLASQALIQQQQRRPHANHDSESPESLRKRPIPPLSADFPRFSTGKVPSINLPPLRLQNPASDSSLSQQHKETSGGLMSPVAFTDGPSYLTASSSSPVFAQAPLVPQSPEKRRRDSSASTITIPSDTEDHSRPKGDVSTSPTASAVSRQARKGASRQVARQRSDESMGSSRSGDLNSNADEYKGSHPKERSISRNSNRSNHSKSPRKRNSTNGSIPKQKSRPISRNNGDGLTDLDQSPRTPPH